jgi:hypothetical protein
VLTSAASSSALRSTSSALPVVQWSLELALCIALGSGSGGGQAGLALARWRHALRALWRATTVVQRVSPPALLGILSSRVVATAGALSSAPGEGQSAAAAVAACSAMGLLLSVLPPAELDHAASGLAAVARKGSLPVACAVSAVFAACALMLLASGDATALRAGAHLSASGALTVAPPSSPPDTAAPARGGNSPLASDRMCACGVRCAADVVAFCVHAAPAAPVAAWPLAAGAEAELRSRLARAGWAEVAHVLPTSVALLRAWSCMLLGESRSGVGSLTMAGEAPADFCGPSVWRAWHGSLR